MNSSNSPVFKPEKPGKLASLPRRQMLSSPTTAAPLNRMRVTSFKLNRVKAIGRLLLWISLIISFYFNTTMWFLLRRNSVSTRARWLRAAFEKRGGSFVKLGMHLSMRLDFLSWEYGVELSKMTDRMKPFPIEDAVHSLEKTIQKPLGSVFKRFDPEPVASTSTACLYQAFLRNETRVIVKVRRPGVGEQFTADLQAFDWLMMLAEFITIFKPGFTYNMRKDFRSFLLDELDFLNEARRQNIFRTAAEESGKKWFTAPKVYLEYSSDSVVVEEFASGMWLWELLAAVEHEDQEVLDYARSINIVPEKVAKRLLWVHYWSLEENLFFRADRHPDNVIIGNDNRMYFVNFAATGTLNRSKRQAMQQIYHYLKEKDPQNMARASLVLMEPLPMIDLIELSQELEWYNWQLIYNLEALPESLEWQERTSAIQWLGIIQLARKYHIAIDLQVLQLLRAALLAEASAVRLFHDIDPITIYEKFEDYRADQASRRVIDQVNSRMEGKEDEKMIIRMDRLAMMLQGLFFRVRHTLTIPDVNFNALINKWSFGMFNLIRFFISVLTVSGAAVTIYLASQMPESLAVLDLPAMVRSIVANSYYQASILLLIVIHGRTVLFRFEDKEVHSRR
jgi:predicted unusual protein kinase regulating ubiquinone biosynthesis (AarF/ABC1/UbiB family)